MFQLLAGRAPLQEVTLLPVEWDATLLPAEYVLTNGGTGYDRSGVDAANDDLRNWVQAEKVMSPGDTGERLGYYWEMALSGSTQFNGYHGVADEAQAATNYNVDLNPVSGSGAGYRGIGSIWAETAQVASGLATYGDGDVAMFAFDPTDGSLWVGVNGLWDTTPWVDNPRVKVLGGPNFRVFGQARAAIDAGILRSTPAQFSYPIPTDFIALADSTPGPAIRPHFWTFFDGDEVHYTLTSERSSTFESTSSLSGIAYGGKVVGGPTQPAGLPAAGYYWEMQLTGFLASPANVSVGLEISSRWGDTPPRTLQWRSDGRFYFNNTSVITNVGTWDKLDRLMLSFNPHTGSIWLGRNGVWIDDPDTDPPTYQFSIGLTLLWRVAVDMRVSSVFGETKGCTVYALPEEMSYTKPTNAILLSQYL